MEGEDPVDRYQGEETTTPIYYTDDYYKGDILRFQLENELLLKKIEHSLRGEIFDEDTQKWVQGKKDPLMNEKGIDKFMSVLHTKIDKSIILSNLKEDDINKRAEANTRAIIDLITEKFQEFEIKKSDATLIVLMIDDAIYTTFMRAKDAGERGLLRGVEKTVYMNRPEQERKGFLGKLIPKF